MKKYDLDVLNAILLGIFLVLTGITGFFSEKFGENSYEIHEKLAFVTFGLVIVHFYFKLPGIIRYLKQRFGNPSKPS